MTIKELIRLKRGILIAYNEQNGQLLFDTSSDSKEHINKYNKGEITSIWAEMEHCCCSSGYYKLTFKCYVVDGSWKEEE